MVSVAVLGAGLAGLAAAISLADQGVDVRVLESRPRVGGRVQTLRQAFADGLYAEAGAEFIGPGHRVVLDFLARYGLSAPPRPEGRRLFRFQGRVEPGEVAVARRTARGDARRLQRRIARLAERVDDPERAWASAAGPELDGQSLGAWLDDARLDPLVRAREAVWITVDYGVEPERISLLMYARDERLLQLGPAGPTRCILGGADQLPAAMATELGPRVHCSTAVLGVEQEAGSLSVEFEQEGAAGRLRAEFAIVALPLAAARQLKLCPPFEAERRAALERVGLGSVLKIMLQTRRRFWRELGLDGGMLSDGLCQAGYESTHSQAGERGILTIYTAGAAARTLAALPEAERLTRCVEQLEALYPGCGDQIERAVATSWDEQPASGGAYSHFPPDTLLAAGPWLARPLGRLHFAGEHTDHWQATMNGALNSGLRAAREVLVRLGR